MKIKSYFLLFLPLCLTGIFTLHAQNEKNVANALIQLDSAHQGYSIFNTKKEKGIDLAAVEQLKLAQRYGDVTYDKFDPFSMVRIYGYAGFDMVIRSRQGLAVYSINSYLFPQVIIPDVIGRDISAHAQTIIAANLSRIGLFFDPFNTGATKNLYGILEFDFTGTTEDNQYSAKIRHTFGEYVWYSGGLLFGQYYHPLFQQESFPRTLSNSMGSSFDPQALVPQFRYSQMVGPIELIFALASEGYIKSWGPNFDDDAYIQDAIVPNFHFQAKWRNDLSFYGGAIDYKRLVPRLVSNTNYKVNEHIDSIIGELFFHNVFWWGELNLKAVYAQNGSDQLLISGFAIRTVDPITNFQTYSNTAAISAWLDTFCVFYAECMSLGLFVGGVKNLGSRNALYIAPGATQPTVYTIDYLAQTLAYTVRVSPRYLFARGSFRFGVELTYDLAAFGTLNQCAQVINAVPVNSFSYEFSLNYVF